MRSSTFSRVAALFVSAGALACNGSKANDNAHDLATHAPSDLAPSACSGATPSTFTPGPAPATASGLTIPAGLRIDKIASVTAARQLAALPNGDLLVATDNSQIYIVPDADDSGAAGAPTVFADIADAPSQGIAFDAATCTVFFATQHGVYSAPYTDGQLTATPVKIAAVRTGSVAPNSDGDIHGTSSVTVTADSLYVGVGSSCNACVEVDPTRATVQQMKKDGSGMTTRATRFRNAIALTVNPATGTVWAGGAGQDGLPLGHPYEFFDALSLNPAVADYGWPDCEENQHAYVSGSDCSKTIIPRVETPAYSTVIGAVFYPAAPSGPYALPAAMRGNAILTLHGSWHMTNGQYYSPPRVALVPMNGDVPVTAVDWSDPSKQWSELVGGYQLADGVTRIGRPTGIAVGKNGSLFIADDQTNAVNRLRPQ
jgi:glucose/arabinose dehydrogenase